jgi:predicted secreted acid phosphatase
MEQLQANDKNIIVFDIDETLINSKGLPIQPIVDTYLFAKEKGLKTAIITARPGSEKNIIETHKQLKTIGIDKYDNMYFLPENKQDPAFFKLSARKDLHKRGYTVVMTIGDMNWDIGAFGGMGFIVPAR